MNLRAAYSINPGTLKFFLQPHLRCTNVHSFSLASCYWLTSSEILWAVQRLTNLKSLYVEDTKLSIEHLTTIMISIKTIDCLSWTINLRISHIGLIKKLCEEMKNLKSLSLWVEGGSYFAIRVALLLSKCSSLEELKVSCCKMQPWCPPEGPLFQPSNVVELPNIKSLILNFPYGESVSNGWLGFLSEILMTVQKSQQCNCIWVDMDPGTSRISSQLDFRELFGKNIHHLYAVSVCLPDKNCLKLLNLKSLRYFTFQKEYYDDDENDDNYSELLENSSITHLVWINKFIPCRLPNGLQHLCIECDRLSTRHILVNAFIYDALPHLKSLSVPACIFFIPIELKCSPSSEREETSVKKSKRKSHCSKKASEDCLLKLFTDIAPGIQKLEVKLELHRSCPVLSHGAMGSLELIGRWKHLESLFLKRIPLFDFSMLVKICCECPKLRRLGLNNVGISGAHHQTWKLVQAIGSLENLEDFSFEHPVVDKLVSILEALAVAPKLCRVSIICEKTTARQNLASYLNLVKKSSLVFLYARVPSITKLMERDFRNELKTKYLKERKSLWASIEGRLKDSFWETIPTIHYYEMISNPAGMNIFL